MDVLFFVLISVFLIIGMPLIMAFNRLSSLEIRIRSLESRLLEEEKKSPTNPQPTSAQNEELPPIIGTDRPNPESIREDPKEAPPIAEPLADPVSLQTAEANISEHQPTLVPTVTDLPEITELQPEPVTAQAAEEPPVIEHATAPLPEPAATPDIAQSDSNSFELQVGKVWFVRIGVGLVLTGLVFLAKMGYQNISEDIRPYLNAALLYLISFSMMGAGLFLHRRFEVLKNYSEVLTGGGMAAVYFSTYALYFVKAPVLGLINSPTMASLLLAAWAVFIIWFATRKASEVMAMFAVAGAYYASYVPLVHAPADSNIWFTFGSNMALAITATVFVIRNRWANLSFLALITTYIGFIFWRLQIEVRTQEEFTQDAIFLGLYWLVFTVAGFLSRHDQMTATKRSTFIHLNNGACFGLLSIVLLQVHELRDQYWVLPLVFSGILMFLYRAAKKSLPEEKLFADLLLAKSAVLFTLGLMTLQHAEEYRALLLSAEAVTLLYFGLRTRNKLLQYGAMIAGVIGGIFVSDELLMHAGNTARQFAVTPLLLGVFFTLFQVTAAGLAYRHRESNLIDGPPLVLASFFAGFGAIMLGATLLTVTHHPYPEYTIAAIFGLALTQIYLNQRWPVPTVKVMGNIYLAGANLLGLIYAMQEIPPNDQLWALPLIGVALSILFLKLRLTTGLIAAQMFILLMVLISPVRMYAGVSGLLALFPFVIMLGMSHFFLHTRQMLEDEEGDSIKHTLATVATQVYFYTGWALSLVWVLKYVPNDWLFLTYTLIAIAHSLAHQRRERLERVIVSGISLATGLTCFWVSLLMAFNDGTTPNVIDLVPLLGLLGAQVFVSRQQGDSMDNTMKIANSAFVVLINTSLWIWTSLMVGGDWDVITWGGLAFILIGMGIWNNERTHRLFGLVVLACSSLYLVLIAFNHLEGAPRILTLIGMGVILIVLGLLYTKNQEKLKEIL